MISKELRAIARNRMQGKWGNIILATLVAGLLGGLVTGDAGSINYKQEPEETYYLLSNPKLLITVTVIVLVASVLAILIHLFFSNIVRMGYSRYLLNVVDQQEQKIDDLFSSFQNYGKTFRLGFYRDIRVFLWTLLFIIPGILAHYNYSMAAFIMLDHPEYTEKQCLEESKRLMYGKRWRLFCLELSFIGWYILSVLSLGIGFIWVFPYENVTYAVFYRHISTPQTDEAIEFIEPDFT